MVVGRLSNPDVDHLFHALADATRRDVLRRWHHGDLSVSRLADAYRFEELVETSALLLGRVTFEVFSAAWPKATGEFADRMNALPKCVVSRTLHEPLEWNASLLKGDLTSEVETLKGQYGDGHVFVHGSRSLAQELLKRGLVDEVRLMVFPAVLGRVRACCPSHPTRPRWRWSAAAPSTPAWSR
jgi:dihydrofolate reductase